MGFFIAIWTEKRSSDAQMCRICIYLHNHGSMKMHREVFQILPLAVAGIAALVAPGTVIFRQGRCIYIYIYNMVLKIFIFLYVLYTYLFISLLTFVLVCTIYHVKKNINHKDIS